MSSLVKIDRAPIELLDFLMIVIELLNFQIFFLPNIASQQPPIFNSRSPDLNTLPIPLLIYFIY
jgi:hypothetical protein